MTSTKENIKLIDNNLLFVILGLTIIFISNLVGHFAAPFSIMVTPIVLPLVIGAINSSLYKANYYLTVFYGFVLLLLNDILVRLYAGGTHDDEGKAWIMLFFIFAFIISILITVTFAFKDNKKPLIVLTKIVFVLIVATLVGLFLWQVLIKRLICFYEGLQNKKSGKTIPERLASSQQLVWLKTGATQHNIKFFLANQQQFWARRYTLGDINSNELLIINLAAGRAGRISITSSSPSPTVVGKLKQTQLSI